MADDLSGRSQSVVTTLAPTGGTSIRGAVTLTAGTNVTITESGQAITINAGTATMGETITGGTQGSVLFVGAAGVLSQDNANFFWDGTNHRLGIGTVNPSNNLQISFANASNDNSGITLSNTNTNGYGGSYNIQISQVGPGTFTGSRIFTENQGVGASAGAFLAFSTANTSQALVERMRIDNAGNVGIGTASPSALFSVGSSSQFQVSSAGAVTAVGVNSGAGLLQGTGGLTVTGTTSINVTGTANTSIGNGTGTFALTSGGGLNVSTAGVLTGVSSIANSGAYTQSGTSANTFTGTSTFSNATYSALFTGGNVGIGTSSPASSLEIKGANSVDGLRVSLTGQNPYLASFFNTAYSASSAVFQYFGDNSGEFRMGSASTTGVGLYTNGQYASPQLYLKSGGSVGIGTTGPSAALHVLSTTEQLRLGYDTSNYASFTTASTGSLTIAPIGTNPSITLTSNNIGIGATPAAFVNVDVQTNLTATGGNAVEMWLRGGITSSANGDTLAVLDIGGTINKSTFTGLNTYGIYLNNVATSGTGTIDNKYGLYVATQTGGTNNYSIYSLAGTNYFGGSVGIGTTSPQTSMDINGGMRTLATAKSANYTLLATDSTILATTGSLGITITLPAATSNNAGIYYFIYKVDAGIGALTIAPTGTDTLNAVNASKTVANQNNGVLVRGAGAGAYIVTSFTGI